MKANDLRMGNFVTYKSMPETICHVNAYMIDEIESEVSNYVPILITEDWLLRFGFRKWGKYAFVKGKCIVNKRKDGFNIAARYRKFQYIHDLQNVYYALIGEELTLQK